MEKRISSKTRLYFQNFKDVLKNKISKDGNMDSKYMNELVQFIYDYPQLTFLPQDFQKRKRVKILFHSLKDVVLEQMENNALGVRKIIQSFVEHT